MWQLPSDTTFEVLPPSNWQNDEASKRLFGIELNHHKTPFEAACAVFKDDTSKALWASQNWLFDPIVIEAKSAYNLAQPAKLLDREALSHRLLTFAEEKDPTGRFYISEGKDRLKAYEIYAKINGFIDKPTDNLPSIINEMKLIFVKPANENQKTIEHEEQSVSSLPVNLKLVSAS